MTEKFLSSAPPLRLVRLHCSLRPQGALYLPVEWRGNKLRGALGEMLRARECGAGCPGAEACPRAGECAYARLFEPVRRGGGAGNDIPRPFLLRPTLDADAQFGPHRPLLFELRLFGRAVEEWAVFVEALRALERDGFGSERTPVRLEPVWGLDWMGRPQGEALVGETIAASMGPPVLRLGEHPAMPQTPANGRLRIEFRTRTAIKRQGRLEPVPSLAGLVARIADRLASLCHWMDDEPWQADLPGLKRLAKEARTVDAQGRWERAGRTSTKTGQSMDLSGFRGWVSYDRVAPELLPLLGWGEEVHAGRAVVWGNGWFCLERASSQLVAVR